MALATRCPHCHTTFKVAQDQLKLRAGLVRCGSCKQIFNGIEHLLPPEEPAKQPAPAQGEQQVMAPATQDTETDEHPDFSPKSDSDLGTAESPSENVLPTESSVASSSAEDPLHDMASENATPDKRSSEESSALPPNRSDDDLLNNETARDTSQQVDSYVATDGEKPASLEEDETNEQDEPDEPDFVVKGRRRKRIGRAMRAIMGAATCLLLVGLVLQSAYVFRDLIASHLPSTKPLLAQMCRTLGCQVNLPEQIEAVSLESSELQALSPEKNVFVLNALLRNRSASAKAWPHMELTLNDTNEQAVARRVFTPRDYLPASQDVGNGFAAESEQTVKLFLSLSQLKASGYRMYLFYP